MVDMIYAEEMNFWQSGRSSPDSWMDKTKRQIATLGGVIHGDAVISNGLETTVFVVEFSIDNERYRLQWPTLPSKSGKTAAARIQAATMLYHYVKSVCLYAVIVGARAAFMTHLVLPDGRVAGEVATPELAEMLPAIPLLTR